MRFGTISTAVTVIVLALAACGDDDREGSFTAEDGTGTETTGTGTTTTPTETTTTPSGEASKTLVVTEVEFKLEPSSLQLAKPGIVQLVVENDGGTVHALEVEGATGEFETEEIQPGDQVRLRADVSEAGNYKLYCPIGDHEQRGMVGELVVGGGSGRGDDKGGERGGSDTGGTEPGGSEDGGEDDTGGAPAPGY